MARIALIDNIDSFTYNVVDLIRSEVPRRLKGGPQNFEVEVFDAHAQLRDLQAFQPDRLVIGPGPGKPSEARLGLQAIEALGANLPIFGVCLGMQCLAWFAGGEEKRCRYPSHGKTIQLHHPGASFFEGIPSPLTVGLYHSLTVEIPPSFQVLAERAGVPMAIEHQWLPWAGVQFHPDSFLTEWGAEIISHFFQAHTSQHENTFPTHPPISRTAPLC